VSYNKAADINPYSVAALSNKGVVLQEMGKPSEALDVFKKVQKKLNFTIDTMRPM
jgi:tetratricopeptide (TPR) repeat protein